MKGQRQGPSISPHSSVIVKMPSTCGASWKRALHSIYIVSSLSVSSSLYFDERTDAIMAMVNWRNSSVISFILIDSAYKTKAK